MGNKKKGAFGKYEALWDEAVATAAKQRAELADSETLVDSFMDPGTTDSLPVIRLDRFYDAWMKGQPIEIDWPPAEVNDGTYLTPEQVEREREETQPRWHTFPHSDDYPVVDIQYMTAAELDTLTHGDKNLLVPEARQSNWRRITPIVDYWGDIWEKHISDFHGAPAIKQPTYLKTKLMRHQLAGVAMMLQSAQSHTMGCINGDEMGLGKTLTTIVACVEAKKRGILRGFATLIITTKSSRPQWIEEMITHFKEGHAPTFLKLRPEDKRSFPAMDILHNKPDFVVMTYHQLLHEWKAVEDFRTMQQLFLMTRDMGKTIEIARLAYKMKISRRTFQLPKPSVLADMWKQMGVHFDVVLDEAQMVQRLSTKGHASVKAIPTGKAFVLTSVFVPDKWHERGGMLDVLPGINPVRHPHLFLSAFATKTESGFNTRKLSPDKQDLLVRFLLGMTFTRCSDVLNLPEPSIRIVMFEIDPLLADSLNEDYARYEKLLSECKGQNSRFFRKAMGLAVRALVRSSNKKLHGAFNGMPKGTTLEGDVTDDPMGTRPNVLMEQSENDSTVLHGHSVMEDQFDAMEFDELRHPSRKRKMGHAPQHGHEEDEEPSTPADEHRMQQIHVHGSDSGSGSHSGSQYDDPSGDEDDSIESLLEVINGTSQGDDLAGVKVDPDSTAEGGEDDDLDTAKFDYEFFDERKRRTGEGRKVWLERLRGWSDEDILSAKVKRILEVLVYNCTTFPGEKTVIFSKFLRFLDVLQEAIKRDNLLGTQMTLCNLNGTMSESARAIHLGTFRNCHDTSAALLVTADAGSTVLDLQAASIMVICEPWWMETTRRQAIGRLLRPGQEKEVKVWQIFCANSAVDTAITMAAERKAATSDAIINTFRKCTNGESLRIPALRVEEPPLRR